MTARIDQLAPERLLAALGLAAGALLIGVLCGMKPTYGIGAVLGLALIGATLANVTLGLALFTVLSFLEVLNSSSTSGTSVTKLFGLVLFVSWLAKTLTTRQPHERLWPRTSPAFSALGIGLVGWSAISIAWAVSSSAAETSTERFLLNLLLFPIVLTTVRRREHLLLILGAFVLGSAISGLYGFLVHTGQGGNRLNGAIGDANEEAAVLVAAIPIAIGLAMAFKDRPILRTLCWIAAPVCLAGVVNTVSRGGLVALGITAVAAFAFSGRWRPWATVVLLVVAVGTVGYFVAIAPYSAQQRITTISSDGRSDLWKVGWSMVRAKPITGVGSGNFQNAEARYAQTSGSLLEASLIIDDPHVAHNVYLEMLADLGIPGLLLFLGLAVASAGAAVRAAYRFRRTGDHQLELVSRCLVLAIVAFMASDFFLSGEYSKQLWLTFALCPAVLALARAQRLPTVSRAARAGR